MPGEEGEKQPEKWGRPERPGRRGPQAGVLGADAPRCLAVCAFPYLLAFTTDSMEIRLVVNGNLVHTAVVPQLQLVASRVSHLSEGFWEPEQPSSRRARTPSHRVRPPCARAPAGAKTQETDRRRVFPCGPLGPRSAPSWFC